MFPGLAKSRSQEGCSRTPERPCVSGSDTVHFLLAFPCLPAAHARLYPYSLYHITRPVGLPYPKSLFVVLRESSCQENVKEIVQQEPPVGPRRGKIIGRDTQVCAQRREGAHLGNQTLACDLRVYYQAGQARMRKTLDRLEKKFSKWI